MFKGPLRFVCWTLTAAALCVCGPSTPGSTSSGAHEPQGSAGPSDGGQETTDGGSTQTVPPADGGVALCQPCAVRDWNLHPAIAQVDGAPEIWAMSDVHGDYQAWLRLLTAAGIIAGAPTTPHAVTWTAGAATLVVVGDLIDKGPDAPDVLRLAVALKAAAAATGGHVVITMGNHEAEFLADPRNSKASGSDGFDPELAGSGWTPEQVAAGQGDLGALVRNLPIGARVNDYFLVHGGDTGGKSLAQLSLELQNGIEAARGFGATVLSDPNSLLEARLNDKAPQWWDATKNPQGLLTQWTAALNAKHLVMGHQPGSVGFSDGSTRAASQLYKAYGGLLYLVDTGLSVGASGSGGALLHVKNAGTPSESTEVVLPNGSAKPL